MIDKNELADESKISDGPYFRCLVQKWNHATFEVSNWNLKKDRYRLECGPVLEMPIWHLKMEEMNMELSAKEIGQRIYFLRGHRVMLDSDLASLYDVETGALKRAVRRNSERFPEDFMFQLTPDEQENLMCQIGTSSLAKKGQHGGLRYLPFVFTQEGVAMLSGVLNSDRAVHVNITIMRAFVKLRELLDTNKDLAKKIDQLEHKFVQHDHQFKAVFEAIRQLMAVGSPLTPKKIKGLSKE